MWRPARHAPNKLGGYGTTYGIYGDKVATGIVDEGATIGESLIVLAEIGGKYYQGYFSSGSLASGHAIISGEQNDILVTDTIIPEPATLALMAAGGAATVLLRRRSKK